MKKTLLSFILISAGALTASAQCTETYAGGFTQAAQTGYVAGQSFTSPCNGNISSIEVPAASTGTNAAGTLNIYAGNGTGTTPIYTQSVPAITIANVGDPITVTITGSVPVMSGNQYTFAMDMDLDVYASSGYAGGDAFQSGQNVNPIDVDFEVDIAAPTGVVEVSNSSTIVYPNPATNLINVSTNEPITLVEVYSVNGSLVKSVKTKSVDVSDLDNGMYFLTVYTTEGATQTKFTKQ